MDNVVPKSYAIPTSSTGATEHTVAPARVTHSIASMAELASDGTFMRVDAAMCALSGYAEADLLVLRIHDITHPDDVHAFHTDVARALATGGAFAHEYRWVRPDGSHLWVSLSGAVRDDHNGQSPRMLVVATDTTARREADIALHQSEAKYRAVFDSIDEGFCIFELLYDENGTAIDYRFLEVNRAFERQTGLLNAPGRLGSEIAPNVESYWIDAYNDVVKTGHPQRLERYNQSTGRWYQVYASRVNGANGYQVCTVFADITERKRAEDAVRESEARLRALIENLPGGAVFIVDRDLRYVLADGEAMQEAGLKASDLVGKTIWEALDADLTAGYEKLYRQALDGEPFAHEHEAHEHSYLTRGTPLRGENGDVYAVLAVSYDITERKQYEERQKFLLRLSDALRPLGDATAIQRAACRLLGEHLGVDRAYYVETNEVEGYARVAWDYVRGDAPSLVGTHRSVDYGWTVPLLQRGVTIVVTDAEASDIIPEADRAAMESVRIAAHITTPVNKAGALVGAVCVTECVPRQWSETEIELVRETAERIWAAIERTRAEAALRASEARFRTVTDAVPQVIWANASDGTANYFNERWFAYSGLSLQASFGPGWQVIVHPDDAPASVERWQQALAAGTIFDTEYRLRRADGVYRWHLGRNVPLHDEQGRVTGWFGSATDIHDERLAREAAQAAQTEAEAALRTRDQFLTIASHELRTPLTSLLGYASMLPMVVGQNTGRAQQMSEHISRQARRLNSLIEHLLDVSRLQQGQFALTFQPVDLGAVVAEVVDEARTMLLPMPQYTLEGSCPHHTVFIAGDGQRLVQVMQNLISNAVKYSPDGGMIRVVVTREATEAVVEVADQGIGIPAEAQARLFEPFYRADNVGDQVSGFGLGLHIVHEIVERHGGRIEVMSAEGEGSTFRVLLPLLDTTTEQ